MKLLVELVVAILLLIAFQVQAEFPQKLDAKLNELLQNLELSEESLYNTEQYIVDLNEVSAIAVKLKIDFKASQMFPASRKRQLLFLAIAIQDREVLSKVTKLGQWYGSYDYDIPDELYEVFMGVGFFEEYGTTLKDHKRRRQESRAANPRIARVVRLREEHSQMEYLVAWQFWLIAPHSGKRHFMKNHIYKAIREIGDESVIPILMNSLEIEIKRARGKSVEYIFSMYLGLISSMPGQQALDSLLECNRFAVKNGFNGDDYYSSITRVVIRCLSSRRAYADSLVDPKMKGVVAGKGYKEKPEDIPLTSENWKKYKPLIEAKLKARNDETPKIDIKLLEEALEIMPKR